jgi:1-deoxy-D-xylulose-5-phosphate reductoisomerase
MIKKVAIFGSTGSIGTTALELIRRNRDKFKVEVLAAGTNVDLLARQAREFRPGTIFIADETKIKELRSLVSDLKIEVCAGEDGLSYCSNLKVDLVLMAIVGAKAIMPTLGAIRAGNNIALANKECLVCAGDLITKEAKKFKVDILPVDSEHNAIFQVFDFKNPHLVDRIILTASGGPFRNHTMKQMEEVTLKQALRHPNWIMGPKVTIDCATMVNKGLEMIEAYHLFPVKQEQIDIVVHPQSIVHSMVSYIDGSTLADLGDPDMTIPISVAFAWPERIETKHRKFDITNIGKLEFFKPDTEKFLAINLVKHCIKTGGAYTIALNAANEIAVEYFLEGKIKFLEIVKTIEKTLEKSSNKQVNSIDEVFEVDKEARAIAKQIVQNIHSIAF